MTNKEDTDDAQLDAALERVERLASQAGRDTELIALCSELERQFPDHFEVFYHRGQAHFAVGDVNAALSDMSRAVLLAPDEPAVFFFRGLWSLEAGLSAQASDDLQQAITLESRLGTQYYMASARLARAVALVEERLFDEALAETAVLKKDIRLFVAGRLWSIDAVKQRANLRGAGKSR